MVIQSLDFETNRTGVKQDVEAVRSAREYTELHLYILSSCNLEWRQRYFSNSLIRRRPPKEQTKQKSRNVRKGTKFSHSSLFMWVSYDGLKALVSYAIKKISSLCLQNCSFFQQEAKHFSYFICNSLI